MAKQNLTLRYAVLQGIYWMMYCSINSYLTIYLTSHGFTAGGVGLLAAAANISTAFLEPAVATLADRSTRRSVWFYARIALAVCMAGILGLCAGASGIAALTACYLPLLVAFHILMPLYNSLDSYYNSRGMHLNFGVGRGTGSVTFALCSTVLGTATAALGVGIIPFVMLGLLILVALSLHLFRVEPAGKGREVARQAAGSENLIQFARRYPDFFLLLVGIALLFINHYHQNTYIYQMTCAVGGGSAEMGRAGAIAAVVELPAMIFFSRMVRRWRCGTLLRVASVFFLLKACAAFLAGSVGQLYLSQAFQVLGFALYLPAGVYYAGQIMAPEDRVKGQAYLTAGTVVGGLVGNLSGGWLLDISGVHTMLGVSLVTSLLGTVVVFAATRKRQS